MSKFAVAASAAALLLSAQAASAAVVLDQASGPESGNIFNHAAGYDFVDSYGWGQSFTVGVDGVLDHIAIGVFASPWLPPPTAPLTVKVLDMAGGVLFSHTYAPAAVPLMRFGVVDWADLFSVDVRSADIGVSVGQKLRWAVFSSGSGSPYDIVRQVDNSLIDYGRGDFWSFRYLPPNGVIWSNNDTLFRTYVDTGSGAPEPAAWALLILGFAGVGAAVRRKSGLAGAEGVADLRKQAAICR